MSSGHEPADIPRHRPGRQSGHQGPAGGDADAAEIVARASAPVALTTPGPAGWSRTPKRSGAASRPAVAVSASGRRRRVAAVGLSTQRESLLLWERATGEPAGAAAQLAGPAHRGLSRCCAGTPPSWCATISGLPLDPMFSAPKARWLLDAYDPRRRQPRRRALPGHGGLLAAHSSAASTSSRPATPPAPSCSTCARRAGTPRLLELFGVPREVLPASCPRAGRSPARATWRRCRTACPSPPSSATRTRRCSPTPAGARHRSRRPTAPARRSWAYRPTAPLSAGLCLHRRLGRRRGPAYAVEGNIRSTGAHPDLAGGAARHDPPDRGQAADASDGVLIVPASAGSAPPGGTRRRSG